MTNDGKTIVELTLSDLAAMSRLEIFNVMQQSRDAQLAFALKAVAENVIVACDAYMTLAR